MTTLGQVLLAVSAIAAFASIGMLAWGHSLGPKKGEGLTNAGYIATFAVFASTTVAVLLLVVAFFRKDFTFLYVAQNHSTNSSSLSWLYNLSGLWAGREGSLLFWAWLLSTFTAYMAYKRMGVTDALSNVGLAITNFVQLFFLVALFIQTNNPFQAAVLGADGTVSNAAGAVIGNINQMAMNPLLEHWAMILHPPALFIGYAGLTIPFAFALAAVFLGDASRAWVDLVDRVTVFAWMFLGIGIALGAIWAYIVLGWGGYWGWDPVENASLLPWLTGLALLHSFTVYRRREGFKRWSVVLAAVSFVLVLLGTFITRSGVIQSVHAFEKDTVSLVWFLGMMVASLVVTFVALAMRGDRFKGNDDFTSLTSKESSYYFNNVIMLFAAVVVAALTLAPVLGKTFGGSTFDLLARPMGILYVAIMAICPILSWRKTEGVAFWKRVRWPLAGAAVLFAGFMTIWYTDLLPNYQVNPKALPALVGIQAPLDHIEAIIGLAVAALALALPVYLFIDGARKRAIAREESFLTALGNIVFKARTQSGGYIAHFGIGIILIGLIGSAMYVNDTPLTVSPTPGTKFSARDYTFVYTGTRDTTLPNGDKMTAVLLNVQKGGVTLAQAEPSQVQYAVQGQTRLNADVHHEFLRDVFVAFQGADSSGALSFDIKINPLVSWAWAGFGILVLGTGLAVWPKPEPVLVAVPAAGKRKKA
jgi:cytochrome c-type biogenesis protein CcmF